MSLITLFIALSLAAAAVCAGLAFTNWGRRRPLHRYGALSIAAHLLLAAGMASVRVGGPPQSGAEDAPPVRVRIVMQTITPPEPEAVPEEAQPEASQTAEAPSPEEPSPETSAPQETEPQETEPQETEPSEPDTALADATPPEPATEPATEPAPAEQAAPTVADAAQPEAPDAPGQEQLAQAAAPQEVSVPVEPVRPATEPEPQPTRPDERQPIEPVARSRPPEPRPAEPIERTATPLAPSTYARRGELAQRRLAADEGGTQETLDAVAAAVDWLARAQQRNGAWNAVRWGAGRETRTLEQDRKGAGGQAETGLTGLALLAMGGAGHTHLAGPYRGSVTAGLQFLLDQQTADGNLAGGASLYARTYCHSMATFALAEAMAVTGDERLRPAVEAAVGYLVRGQSRAGGGWRYQPGDRGDMSQMGWAVMALRSAELAGVAIPASTWHGCERFVASVQRGRGGGLACYQPQGPTSHTMTAEAMYCRQILGVARRGGADEEAVASLLDEPPGSRSGRTGPRGKANLYYWYYATLALHHHRATSNEAERAWRRWNDAMQDALLPTQIGQGPTAGSWGADTVWGGYGGRVYSTALATMCLEVYYRYDPDKIGRDPWLAARGGVIRR